MRGLKSPAVIGCLSGTIRHCHQVPLRMIHSRPTGAGPLNCSRPFHSLGAFFRKKWRQVFSSWRGPALRRYPPCLALHSVFWVPLSGGVCRSHPKMAGRNRSSSGMAISGRPGPGRHLRRASWQRCFTRRKQANICDGKLRMMNGVGFPKKRRISAILPPGHADISPPT